VIPLELAFQKTFEWLPSPEVITLPLAQSLYHILASPLRADRPLPPFHKSAVDGYAIAPPKSTPPLRFEVVGLAKAGKAWEGTLQPDQACQIMTGAPVPLGTDRIIMVEDTLREGNTVQLFQVGKPQQHIQPKGIEVCQGDQVLNPHTLIRPTEIGTLASFGKAEVSVYRKPKVAVVATGDELVEPHETPGPDQIRNSNGYSLCAQIQANHFNCDLLGIARDTRESISAFLEKGFHYDVLILSGGVSMGEYDYVKEVLLQHRAQFQYDKIALKPGKPLVFGKVPSTFLFGLPGNPGSSFTTCELFVIPFLRGFAGYSPYRSTRYTGILDFPFHIKGDRIQYLPVWIRFVDQHWKIFKLPYAGSSDVVALSRANGFLILEPEQKFQVGDCAPFQWFSPHLDL
jgi:molybdopterin molybdotransferase